MHCQPVLSSALDLCVFGRENVSLGQFMLISILHRHVGTNDLGYDAGKHDSNINSVCLGLQRSRC